MGGSVNITQGSGALTVGSIKGSSIALTAANGAITQTAPLVTAGLLSLNAANGATLTNTGNQVAAFSASTTGAGNVALTNGAPLDVQGISVVSGNVALDNTGAISNSGTITASAGTVDITAHSPIGIGNTVNASGNITLSALTANTTSNITLNGAMTSGAGGIFITAYNNITQNSRLTAAQAVNVTSQFGSFSFGPGAFSVGNPVTYMVGNVPFIPPWIAASLSGGATDFVVSFMDQFLAVLDAQALSVDDPLGLTLRGNEGIVVEGQLCTP
jgi:hypothetical protein